MSSWPEQEVLRIEALSNPEVLIELQDIMVGTNYSWSRIHYLFQEKAGTLPTLLIEEWKNAREERMAWELKGRLSANIDDYRRDFLINLKLFPFMGGLGSESIDLVTRRIVEDVADQMKSEDHGSVYDDEHHTREDESADSEGDSEGDSEESDSEEGDSDGNSVYGSEVDDSEGRGSDGSNEDEGVSLLMS